MIATEPPLVVVMGVSGSGKTTAGKALSVKLGLEYVDADTLHPPVNVGKMQAGRALADEDRWPWLDAVGSWLATHGVCGAIVSCSVLRRAYRDRIRGIVPTAAFWHLAGPEVVVERRMRARRNHFMPASLLRSQYEALEPLGPDEHGLTVDLDKPVPDLVDEFAAWLASHSAT